jgi:GH25 family lysozyme M1 (1,4-beta-N-acetylmuramidase)
VRARGADFSSAQRLAQVEHVAKGVAFAFVKATQGTGYVNPSFTAQVRMLRQCGVVVGVYHFLEHDVDGAAQFDHLFANVGSRYALVACDQETDRGVLVPDHIARAFIRRAHQRGVKVGRYGDGRVMRRSLGEDWKWVAWWGKTPPPFKWDFWQFSNGDGKQDWNLFRGNAAQLAALGRKLKPKPKLAPLRWWLHDDRAKVARGPYRLAALAPAVAAYLAKHPRVVRLRLERK